MLEKLFTQKKIGTLELKNRFIMSSMNSKTTKNHIYLERGVKYYGERAKGEFALLMTEFLAVDKNGLGSLNEPGIWDDSFIDSLSRLTSEVHKNSGLIFAQLHHAGAIAVSNEEDFIPLAPSKIQIYSKVVKDMTISEIESVIDMFISASVRAKKAGFDGVELHGAHGYLLSQFLSNANNKRNDEYGGSHKNRFRIIDKIIKGIKKQNGEDFPLSVRINVKEKLSDGVELEDAIIYAQMIEKSGADALNVSVENPIQSYFRKPGFNVKWSKEIKKVVDIPVIISGRLNNSDMCRSIVENDYADFVSLGRQSIADPHFPKKIREGVEDEIIHCVGCLQRCSPSIGYDETDVGISCIFNPFSGKENRWYIEENLYGKTAAIIGGGIAGLQSAWILSQRGCEVHIYEKDKLGGLLNIGAVPPNKSEFGKIIYTLKRMCERNNVQFHLNETVTADSRAIKEKDYIIIATGSKPLMPNIPGLKENAITADDVLSGKVKIENKKVLILGGGSVGLETAEYLNIMDNNSTIIDMDKVPAKEMVSVIRDELINNLKKEGTTFVLDTKVNEVFKSGVEYQKDECIKTLAGFDLVVCALGYVSNNQLSKEIEDKLNVYIIGDAVKARNIKTAIYEATKLAIEIGG